LSEVVETPQSQDRTPRHAIGLAAPAAASDLPRERFSPLALFGLKPVSHLSPKYAADIGGRGSAGACTAAVIAISGPVLRHRCTMSAPACRGRSLTRPWSDTASTKLEKTVFVLP
jgi:hypothetical protein